MLNEAPSNVAVRSGFGASSWLGSNGFVLAEGSGSLALTQTRLKAVFPLTCTPPWALHADLSGSREEQRAMLSQLATLAKGFCVLDLGPRAFDCLEAPRGWFDVLRHTRQIRLLEGQDVPVPKNRLKQERRFLREGGDVHVSDLDPMAWQAVAELHQVARERKGLSSHAHNLKPLLARLAPERWTFAVVAVDRQGQTVASGGFVLLEDGTCVYAFGGQRRSAESGRASVAMLLAAMREATQKGCTRFDFGGSQDDGVDQFYAEFGADVVPMRRWVKAPRWFAWAFPRMWKVWTRPTRHR